MDIKEIGYAGVTKVAAFVTGLIAFVMVSLAGAFVACCWVLMALPSGPCADQVYTIGSGHLRESLSCRDDQAMEVTTGGGSETVVKCTCKGP